MGCLITNGIGISCRSAIGGVDSVYIANYEVGLSYSFATTGDVDYLTLTRISGITHSVYYVTYTEPLSATQAFTALHPRVGEVVDVSMNDPAYSNFNGTQSVLLSVRVGTGSTVGRTFVVTDRLYDPLAAYGPVSGTVYYNDNSMTGFEITRLPNINFYKLNQPSEVAAFNQVEYTSTENGTSYYEQTTEVTLFDLPATRQFIQTLNTGVWVLLIKDMMDNYWISGYLQGARTDTSISSSGKLLGDLNGTTISFKSKGPIAYKVTASAARARIVEG